MATTTQKRSIRTTLLCTSALCPNKHKHITTKIQMRQPSSCCCCSASETYYLLDLTHSTNAFVKSERNASIADVGDLKFSATVPGALLLRKESRHSTAPHPMPSCRQERWRLRFKYTRWLRGRRYLSYLAPL